MKNKLPNIHPGEILREEFLTPMEISAYRLSKETVRRSYRQDKNPSKPSGEADDVQGSTA